MTKQYERVQLAEKGAKLSITFYIIIAIFKLGVGYFFNSSSLTADGFNNFTDIISSTTVLIGLRTARKPADNNHPYGHWKAEPISSLITSFVMLLVGFQVLISTISRFVQNDIVSPDPIAAIVAVISAFILFFLYRYNLSLSKKSKSFGLKAVAKDNLADSITSLATAVAIIASTFQMPWIDLLMALLVSLIILKTGYDVFRESSFSLSDGFHKNELLEYRNAIEKHPRINGVVSCKARMYGTNIYVDTTIIVDDKMTVKESHDITEEIEKMLFEEFDVFYTDVHVEPDTLASQFTEEQM